jgi:hypothetical protein
VTPAALRRLAGLAEARRARDLARLDRLLTRDRELAAEIASLRTTLEGDATAGIPLPPTQQALRQAWVDQRIGAAERQRTALVPAIAAGRAEAVQSLGKHRALENLVDCGEKDARQQRLARAEREAPPAAPHSG